MEDLTKKINESSQHEIKGAIEMSNKVMLKRFIKQFNESLNMVVTSESPNKLNLIQINTLFEILKLISPPEKDKGLLPKESKNVNRDELLNISKDLPVNESTLKQHEKKLVCKIWENLKDDEGLIISDYIFLFLIAILNIYEYYLYDSFKTSQKPVEENKEEKKDLDEGEVNDFNNNDPNLKLTTKESTSKLKGKKLDEKTKKEIEKEQIMKKIQEDIITKVKISKRYCSFDDSHSFLLSFENAKQINKDFNLFYVNWSTNNYLALKTSYYEESEKTNIPGSYKPKINEKSAKLFTEFRKKLQQDTAGMILNKDRYVCSETY